MLDYAALPAACVVGPSSAALMGSARMISK